MPAPQPHAVHTPRVRVFIAMSLDGYIADDDGGFEWLNEYDDAEIDFKSFTASIGLTLIGRTTFDQTREHLSPEMGPLIVLTNRPIDDPPEYVRAESGESGEITRRLRAELAGTGKDIWHMGGGKSIRPFHEAGLIDRWEISVIPILLGRGIPLFPDRGGAFEKLALVDHGALSNGIVNLVYEPAGD